MTEAHLVPLPGTRWQAWRWAMLRSAGFAATGPQWLGSRSAALAADAYLAGHGDEAAFAEAFEQAGAAREDEDLWGSDVVDCVPPSTYGLSLIHI